eukprot:8574467-Heterocapsa_arctica.AAC.1
MDMTYAGHDSCEHHQAEIGESACAVIYICVRNYTEPPLMFSMLRPDNLLRNHANLLTQDV